MGESGYADGCSRLFGPTQREPKMTQLQVLPVEAESAGPMAQILWLHQGRWLDVPVAAPVTARQTSPAGWYVDRLRFWDGSAWTDKWRPISRPKPAMRVRDEESLRAGLSLATADAEPGPFVGPAEPGLLGGAVQPELGTGHVEPGPFAATAVGLLGMPPPLAPASLFSTAGDRPGDLGPSPRQVGLLGMPPPLPCTARAPKRRAGSRMRGIRSMLG
jgi:hypothetical protein